MLRATSTARPTTASTLQEYRHDAPSWPLQVLVARIQPEHRITVPVLAVQAWEGLLEVERIAPCMPGATVESFDGETIEGRVKVKVGPIQVGYAGTARFVEKDAASHRAVIEASARES